MNAQTLEHLNDMFQSAARHEGALYHERIQYCRGMIAALQIEQIITQAEADMFYTRFKANELRRSVEHMRALRMATQ